MSGLSVSPYDRVITLIWTPFPIFLIKSHLSGWEVGDCSHDEGGDDVMMQIDFHPFANVLYLGRNV